MKQGRKINWLKTTILVLLACGVAGLGLAVANRLKKAAGFHVIAL